MNLKKTLILSSALCALYGTTSFSSEVLNTTEQELTSVRLSIVDQFISLLREQDSQYLRNFKAFEEATNKICQIIGTQFDNNVRPSGADLHYWINGIISARHVFRDQPCLGESGMVMRYTNNKLTATSCEEEQHLACIMAIDGIIKYAIGNLADDDFWNQLQTINPSSEVPHDFITKVITCINEKTMDSLQGDYTTLNAAIRTTLETEHELVALTRDIFNIHAPAFNYHQFFSYFFVGDFHGWEMENVSQFVTPYAVRETEVAENARQNLEKIQNTIQQLFNDTFNNDSPPVLALSRRALIDKDGQFIKVQYTYQPDEVIDIANIFGVESMSSVTLTLKRNIQQTINPEILHLLQQPETQLQQIDIDDIYKHQRKDMDVFGSNTTLISGVERGVPSAFFFSTSRLIDGGDALQMGHQLSSADVFKHLQNARNLGFKFAEKSVEGRCIRWVENMLEKNQPLSLGSLKWIIRPLRFYINKEEKGSVIFEQLNKRKQKLDECLDKVGLLYGRE